MCEQLLRTAAKKKESPWKTVVYQRFPKLSLVSNIGTYFILAVRVGNGPRPDIDEFRGLIDLAAKRVRLHRILADAGEATSAKAKQTQAATKNCT